MSLRSLPFLHRYAVAVGLVLVAFALRVAVEGWQPDDVAYAPFIPAVVVATGLVGLGPGLVAAFLALPLAIYWFVAPVGSFQTADWQDLAAVVMLACVAIFSAIVVDLFRAASDTADEC